MKRPIVKCEYCGEGVYSINGRENKDRKMEYQKKWRASHPDYVKNYNEANLVTRTVEYYLRGSTTGS